MKRKNAEIDSGNRLRGCCFAITGALSTSRQEFEQLIQQNGGAIAKTITNACTHLVSSVSGTKKCQDAERKGIQVVNESWVRNRIEGNDGNENQTKGKKTKASPAPTPTRVKLSNSSSTSGKLSGLTFAITGTLSVSRNEFQTFITTNGGQIAKTVTNKVTHLVSSESGTKKCDEAEEKGVKIVDEEWVRDKVEGIEHDDSDHDEEDENEEEDDDAKEGSEDGDEEAIEERYKPPRNDYPTTTIFDQSFLNQFWKSPVNVRATGRPVTNKMIHDAEKQLGFKLPASYIELIRSQNGGRPKFQTFQFKKSNKTRRVEIETLMGCDQRCDESLTGGSGSEFYLEEWEYPRIGIYFGSCPSGGHDLICLDYRSCGVNGEPQVTHVDQELDFEKVVIAPNFESFVRGLCEATEEEEEDEEEED